MGDEVAATPQGAESAVPAIPQTNHAAATDRFKAFLSQSEAAPKDEEQSSSAETVERVDPKASNDEQTDEVADTPDTDGNEEQVKVKPQSLKDLAETLGADIEDILGIDIPTKIDGKEGNARLRDLIKSYQLESHLNQKSMAFADERKAFEAEAQRKSAEIHQKVQQIDSAVQVAQRLLDAEFANVNWDELQATDRLEFNSKVVEYQQRQQALQHLAGIIGQERQQSEQQAAAQAQAYKAEQLRLLESKLPEWTDKTKREADIKKMTDYAQTYGITPEQVKSETNHALILILRDASKWHELQQSKSSTLNKVKEAPKLLKPGTPQSRAAQDGLAKQQARDKLRSTGKVSDAANAFKKLGVV